jgi:hypothetical protein
MVLQHNIKQQEQVMNQSLTTLLRRAVAAGLMLVLVEILLMEEMAALAAEVPGKDLEELHLHLVKAITEAMPFLLPMDSLLVVAVEEQVLLEEMVVEQIMPLFNLEMVALAYHHLLLGHQ